MDLAARPWRRHYDPDTPPFNPLALDMTVLDLVQRTTATFGDKVAFRTVMPNGMAGAMTFVETARRARAFAAFLREDLALAPGDRVAILAPNGLAYPVVALGTLCAGLVLVNINPLYTADEIVATLADSRPKVIVAIDMFADRLASALKREPVPHVILTQAAEFFPFAQRTLIGAVQRFVRRQIPPAPFAHLRFPKAIARGKRKLVGDAGGYAKDITPESIALLQYTGGTTGISKGAALTHRNLMANVEQFLTFAHLVIRKEDVILTALPLYHIFAFTVNFLGGFTRGAECLLIPSPRPLANLKAAFERFGPTLITGVNTLFNGLLNEGWFRDHPPRSLRMSVAGGMALQSVVASRWQEITGTPLFEGYGLTEASPVVSFNPSQRARIGTIGVPLPETDIRVVGPDGADVPPGEAGELLVRGPQVMAGYWQRPDETARVMRDGWLATGDIASIDAEGYLTIVDRLKDMIIVSGFNVFPNEVEEVLARCPGVRECAVIGVPDEAAGEVPKAFIVKADPSLDFAAVRSHCRDHLAGYKVPRHVEFRVELPKTPVGKILRKALRE